MDILISDNQFKDVCLKESCVVELISLLNNVNTKKIFRESIDAMLDKHKMYLRPRRRSTDLKCLSFETLGRDSRG